MPKFALNCQKACWTLVYIWGSARFVSWDICGPMYDHANPQIPSTWWHQKPHWYRQRLNARFHQHWWCCSLLTNPNKPAKLCALVNWLCNILLQLEKIGYLKRIVWETQNIIRRINMSKFCKKTLIADVKIAFCKLCDLQVMTRLLCRVQHQSYDIYTQQLPWDRRSESQTAGGRRTLIVLITVHLASLLSWSMIRSPKSSKDSYVPSL